jgi:ABC-type sulfate/molybdate transport systems ATPase subunit
MKVANDTNFSGLNIMKKKLNNNKCKTFVEQQLKQQHLEFMSKSKPSQLEQQYLELVNNSKPLQSEQQ